MKVHLANNIGEMAAGTLHAQRFVQSLRLNKAEPSEAHDRLKEVQIEFGLESPAIGAWLTEIAKRVR